MGCISSRPSRVDPGTPIAELGSSSEDVSPTKTNVQGQLAAAGDQPDRTAAGLDTGVRVSRSQPLVGGLPRPDSPETNRTTTRTVQKGQGRDDIVTVWQPDDDTASGSSSSRPSPSRGSNGTRSRKAFASPAEPSESRSSRGFGQKLPRADSCKAAAPAILTFHGASAGSASTTTSVPPAGPWAPGQGGRTYHDDLGLEQTLQQLDPSANNTNNTWGAGGRRARPAPPGEMVLSLSDDEELDAIAAPAEAFSMRRWKRHYHWNKTKHKDLLRFLWRHYDRKGWTFYCITHRHSAALFSSYQGENICHGTACRMEDVALGGRATLCSDVDSTAPGAVNGGPDQEKAEEEPLFGVLHTLMDHKTNTFKVVGLLLARGTGPSPACLSALRELSEQWHVHPADVSDPLVRTFVSNLLTGQPPTPQCTVLHTREVV